MSYENLEPRCREPQYMARPTTVDCLACWPNPGWGWRPTRKGKANWRQGAQITQHDVKGVCFTCAGTGLIAIPMREVIAKWEWDDDDRDQWLNGPDK